MFMVQYWRYLRVFDDGTVLFSMSFDKPVKGVDGARSSVWMRMRKENLGVIDTVREGQWKMRGTRLFINVPGSHGELGFLDFELGGTRSKSYLTFIEYFDEFPQEGRWGARRTINYDTESTRFKFYNDKLL